MSPATLASRAAIVAAVGSVLEALALQALTMLAGVPLPLVDGWLLLVATNALGAVWALRAHLRDRSPHAALASAVVPLVATALFVAPRVWVGSAQPAWLTLAVVGLFSLGVERSWSTWILAEPRPTDWTRAFRAAAPVASVGFAIAGSSSAGAATAVGLGGVVAAAALAVHVRRTARGLGRAAAAFAEVLDGIEIRPESIVVPVYAAPTDPWLREVDRRLRLRASEVASVAQQDEDARRQIREARELRTRFMASMSHELRSPLNSIVGFAQLLERGIDGTLSEGQRESVVMVRRSAEELIRLLTDVLDLARLEAGKLHLEREWIPSVELLTEAVARGTKLVEGREVRIVAELQPGLPAVHVDRRRIVQAVIALFRHAAAVIERAEIRVRTRIAPGPPGPDPQLRIELYDAVGAIPPEEVARVLEAFQEITEPTGRRVGGLGMALSLSRALVRLHGGDVWAESVPGAGTILCVALPLEEDEA